MTSDTHAPEFTEEPAPDDDDGRLFCYRHPDRETWVRCGRCDRPICPNCAMQGPVGFRCRDCGKPAYDPLTSFTPSQAIGGFAVALVGGLIVAIIAPRLGWFSLFISFFAGGFIAQAVTNVTGYKAGPTMVGIVLGGIAVGALVAFGFDYGYVFSAVLASSDVGAAMGEVFGQLLLPGLAWAAFGAIVTGAGAWSRMR